MIGEFYTDFSGCFGLVFQWKQRWPGGVVPLQENFNGIVNYLIEIPHIFLKDV